MRTLRRGLVTAVLAAGAVVVWAAPAAADMPGAGIVDRLVGGASGWAFDQVTDGITRWVLDAVGYFVDGAANFLKTSATPDVTAVWFSGPGSPYAAVRRIAGLLLVGFVFLAILQGLVRGDGGATVSRLALTVPAAVLAMVATTTVVGKLLELTDALSTEVLSATGGQAGDFLAGFGAMTAGAGGFAAVLIGLAAVVAGLLLWIELLVRSALVYLLVALSPLCFAAMVWPAARQASRRLVELLLAVVLSKLAISIALSVGVAALDATTSPAASAGVGERAADGLGSLLVGTVVLGLAACSPFVILRLLPLAEGALVAQGISRSPLRTGVSGFYLGTSVQRLAAAPVAVAAGAAGTVGAAAGASRAAGDGYAIGRTETLQRLGGSNRQECPS